MTPLLELCAAIQKRAEAKDKAFFTDAAGRAYVRNEEDYQTYCYWKNQVEILRG